MHEVFHTHVLGQEIARETRKQQFGRLDPDELHKYEVWDSLDSTPTMKDLFISIRSWFRSRKSTAKPESKGASTVCGPSGKRVPQS